MADAMYAPVVTRFLTYDVKLDDACIRAYSRHDHGDARDGRVDRRGEARARRHRRARHGLLTARRRAPHAGGAARPVSCASRGAPVVAARHGRNASSASSVASGASAIGRWPQRGSVTTRAPAMRAASAFAPRAVVIRSSSPTTTSVGPRQRATAASPPRYASQARKSFSRHARRLAFHQATAAPHDVEARPRRRRLVRVAAERRVRRPQADHLDRARLVVARGIEQHGRTPASGHAVDSSAIASTAIDDPTLRAAASSAISEPMLWPTSDARSAPAAASSASDPVGHRLDRRERRTGAAPVARQVDREHGAAVMREIVATAAPTRCGRAARRGSSRRPAARRRSARPPV